MEPIKPANTYAARPSGTAIYRHGAHVFKVYYVDIYGREHPERYEWALCGLQPRQRAEPAARRPTSRGLARRRLPPHHQGLPLRAQRRDDHARPRLPDRGLHRDQPAARRGLSSSSPATPRRSSPPTSTASGPRPARSRSTCSAGRTGARPSSPTTPSWGYFAAAGVASYLWQDRLSRRGERGFTIWYG